MDFKKIGITGAIGFVAMGWALDRFK